MRKDELCMTEALHAHTDSLPLSHTHQWSGTTYVLKCLSESSLGSLSKNTCNCIEAPFAAAHLEQLFNSLCWPALTALHLHSIYIYISHWPGPEKSGHFDRHSS